LHAVPDRGDDSIPRSPFAVIPQSADFIPVTEAGMARFLILPAREIIEHSVAEFIGRLLPGHSVPAGMWERIVRDVTENQASSGNEPIVLHREDLLEEGDLIDSLVQGFGAEPGDEVTEIEAIRANREGRSKTWHIPQVSIESVAR
jgi:hypothetical protein